MNFAKNDNTFPTASLVPIILAAGTVYVGRRYLASLILTRNSGNIGSNPVTRRRRFAKYSFPRRPLPVVTTTTNTCDCSKKSVPSNQDISVDKDMPGPNNRRITKNRITLSSSSVPVINDPHNNRYSPLNTGVPLSNSGFEATIAPKHIPFPNMNVDPEVMFEFVMFMFTLLAGGLQFVHLYRSVWWLPNAYTSQALNFYLIDPYIVIFIVTLLCRRFVLASSCWILLRMVSLKYYPIIVKILKTLLLITIFSILSWCVYNIMQSHAVVNIFFLVYPVCVYVILFGLNPNEFLELVKPSELPYAEIYPMHSCNSNPLTVRAEVEMLKFDFNNRMKQILFNSILIAYYTSFIPCCYTQSFLYYDVYWATQHLAYVFVGCFTMYTVQMVPAKYCDILHRSAIHLGGWTRLEGPSAMISSSRNASTASGLQGWNPETLYPGGMIVRHCREIYKSHSYCNAAEPGNSLHSRFYAVFKNPSTALCGLLGLQVTLVLHQLILLARSSHWYHVISLTLLLFVNYYTLFKLSRDYIVSWKVYKNIRRSSV